MISSEEPNHAVADKEFINDEARNCEHRAAT